MRARELCLVLTCALLTGCGSSDSDSREPSRSSETTNAAAPTQDTLNANHGDLRDKEKDLADLRKRLSEMTKAFEKAQLQLQQVPPASEPPGQQAEPTQAQFEKTKNELRRISGLLAASEKERIASHSILKDWTAFYKEYELQIRDYESRIQARDNEIQQLKAEIEGTDPVDPPAPKIPERLAPEKLRAISRRQFSAIVFEMSTTELLNYLGEPDEITGSSPTYYVYNRSITYGYDKDRKDDSVKLAVYDDVVKESFFTE